jgi:excisionase family DNA binding protein
VGELNLNAMIRNQQIVDGVKDALAKAFKQWLQENKDEIVKVVAASVATKVQPQTPASKPHVQAGQPFLTTCELARRWGVHQETVRRIARRRGLSSMKMGRRVLVPVKAVEEYEKDATLPRRA